LQGVSVLPGAGRGQSRSEGEFRQVTFKETVLSEFDAEMAATRQVLDRLPDAAFGWKPHVRSMSLGGLATHLAQIPHWGTSILERDGYDLVDSGAESGSSRVTELRTLVQVLEAFDRHTGEARKILIQQSDVELMAPWSLTRSG